MSHDGDEFVARKRLFDKCFYYWDVDKRGGRVSVDEITGLFVTYKGPRAAELRDAWAERLKSTFDIVVRHRSRQKAGFDLHAFHTALAKEIEQSPFVLHPARADWGGWHDHLVVEQKNDSATDVDSELERYERKKISATLCFREILPSLLRDTEEGLLQILGASHGEQTPPTENVFHSQYEVVSFERTPAAVVSAGLSKADTRATITELTASFLTDELEVFANHIIATLDFVYDISHRNKRSRMLFESFKFWDNKDRGFIPVEDFVRRMQATKIAQENPLHNINSILEDVLNDPDMEEIRLTDFKYIMNKIFLEVNEQDADEILRSIRRQLKGDDDMKDERYASCRFLKSEAERKLRKNESEAKMRERRQSFDHKMRSSTESEMVQLRIERLESKRRHAFDAVTFDDITSLLECSVAPPAVRSTYSKVAAAVCVLLDIPPTFVDGRPDYWAAIAAELKADMVGFLRMISDYNVANLSYVRICNCMSALQEHSYPSHVLPVSWFLSSMSEWARAVCECMCVRKNWEWPPPPLQANASNFAVSSQLGIAGPRPPSAPTSAGSATVAVKTSRSRAGAKSAGMRRVSDGLTQGAQVPESPFRANNLFYRRRQPRADNYQQFMDKLTTQRQVQERNAAAEEEEQAAVGVGALTECNIRDHLRTDTEVNHYKVLEGLNESLGLPQQSPLYYADHPATATRPYWADDHYARGNP